MTAITLLDCEASSLGRDSYPIEIGWCFLDSGQVESHLILPHPDWIDWDPAAQEAHGISRKMLFEKGEAGPEVCRRVVAALDGFCVYADSEFDERWIATLCAKADIWPAPKLLPFEALLHHVLHGTDPDARAVLIERARQRAASHAPLTHRAGPDAYHLRAVYLEVLAGQTGF